MKFADLPAERRRLLTFHARSAAVLSLGDAKIRELEPLKLADLDEDETARAKEAKSLGARLTFIEDLALVRRMAAKKPIYERVDGIDYIMYAPDETTDRRIVAMDRLAKKLGLARADVDAEANRILEIEESDRARAEHLAAEFMAKLPPPPKRWTRPSTGDRRSWRRVVNYDATALDAVAAVLPERRLAWVERNDLGEQLLEDTDAHLRQADVAEGPAPATQETPARRASLLRAACEVAVKYDAARKAALKRKSAILLKEFPKGAGDGDRYAARSSDLDAELIQPLQEDLLAVTAGLELAMFGPHGDRLDLDVDAADGFARLRRMVIKYAVRVAPRESWPPGNSQIERAIALGRTIEVADADLEMARATLGLARMETKHEVR